jgi:hypothetical protein
MSVPDPPEVLSTVDPSTPIALLRACLAGDESGVAVIVESAPPVVLCMALAAWANETALAWYAGDRAAYDEALADVLLAMAGNWGVT